MTSAEPARQQRSVDAAFERRNVTGSMIDEGLSKLREQIKALEERVNPVLSAPDPETEDSPAGESEPTTHCELAELIETGNRADRSRLREVQQMVNHLDNIRCRVEL